MARQPLADVPDATRGVVVGDARRNSDVFAKATAEVIAGHGLEGLVAAQGRAVTPVGAFLGRYKGAAGVVIVTASHNPPEYNGYKVYGPSASQIVPPQDERIRVLRDQVDPAHVRELPRVDFTQGVREGLITLVTHAEFEAFFDEIGAQCLGTNPPPAQIAAVTTALHGVGHEWVAEALSRRGHRHLFPVLAQAAPDGRFPTVRFPNPEEKGALDLALELAREKFAEVILANDPDTDRLCVAVRDESKPAGYRVLTGNEVGLLLADWILVQGPIVRGADWPKKPLVACSLVSTMMLEPLATLRGAVYGEVLTGFKWIWDLALKRAPDETYVFGFEEALGYCVGPAVRDKDGVGAAQAVMDLAAFEKARGRTLLDRLDDIAHAIGASHTDQVTAVLPGIDGMARIKRVMAAWRGAAGHPREGAHQQAARSVRPGGRRHRHAPRGDAFTWWLADGSRIPVAAPERHRAEAQGAPRRATPSAPTASRPRAPSRGRAPPSWRWASARPSIRSSSH
ncbi:MAG: phospho-sugar mutase [Myxococcota bacterium]